MPTKLFLAVMLFVATMQTSCGGTEEPELVLEAAAPDYLPSAVPHEGLDLGMVVSSGIIPSANIPPGPESDR
ncbi:MAG: hypothetical protein Q8L48_18330 [Archangium sp.]|nr:hypothetical protein [Archangium sp.]